MLLPESTWIGVLGGGQLGRMLAMEARRMGYRIAQWVGEKDSGPAGFADRVFEDSFSCPATLSAFLDLVDVVTVEFENIPADLLQAIEARKPLHPSARAIGICQHREREKLFLRDHRIPHAPFAVVTSLEELIEANRDLPGDERVLKTAEFGYDGKGQRSFSKSERDLASIWSGLQASRAVLEQKIDLKGELSVLVARNAAGEMAVYDPAENIHTRHILDLSIVPARFEPSVLRQAQETAREICLAFPYTGLLAVEFFLSRDGALLVNEMAPRPHNSGHHTLDACHTSQFEQQLRAICGLSLGDPALKCPAVMWNLMGDLWPEHGNPDWAAILREPGAALHLYGKHEARAGRKMGHVTFTGRDPDILLERARRTASALGWK